MGTFLFLTLSQFEETCCDIRLRPPVFHFHLLTISFKCEFWANLWNVGINKMCIWSISMKQSEVNKPSSEAVRRRQCMVPTCLVPVMWSLYCKLRLSLAGVPSKIAEMYFSWMRSKKTVCFHSKLMKGVSNRGWIQQHHGTPMISSPAQFLWC